MKKPQRYQHEDMDYPEGPHKFFVGQVVVHDTADQQFEGRVIGNLVKIDGSLRVAVENQDGLIHIFSESQLEACA